LGKIKEGKGRVCSLLMGTIGQFGRETTLKEMTEGEDGRK